MNNTLAIYKLLKAQEQEKENFQQQIDNLKNQGMIVINGSKNLICSVNNPSVHLHWGADLIAHLPIYEAN